MKKNKWNIIYLVLAFAIGGVLTSCGDALDEIGANIEDANLKNGEGSDGTPPPPPKP